MKKHIASLQQWIAVVVVIASSVVFYRGVFDSFDLTKATILWVSAGLLLLVWGVSTPWKSWNIRSLLPLTVFILATAISCAFSSYPWISLYGQYQRYGGLLTVVSGGILAVTISTFSSTRSQQRVGLGLAFGSVVCSCYVALQATGNDPFEWVSTGISRSILGTVGNPNTSTGLMAIAVVFIFWFGLEKSSRVVSVGSNLVVVWISGTIGILDSFQGVLVLGLNLVLVLLWVLTAERDVGCRTSAFVTALLSTYLASREAPITVILVLASVVALVTSGFIYLSRTSSFLSSTSSVGMKWGVAATACVVIIGGSLFGSLLLDEFAGGMRERGDFYRTAFTILRENLLLGTGPDTYGQFFTLNRPAGHALNRELNISSSVHSIPLGMFSNGGILVGLSYLFLVLSLGKRAFIGVRKSWSKPDFGFVIGMTWLASQVQSIFSVEHVTLFVVFFAVSGLVLAPRGDEGFQSSRPIRQSARFGLRVAAAASAAVVIFLAPRYFLADLRSIESAKATGRGNAEVAISKMTESRDLVPWESQYAIRQMELFNALQDPGMASQAASDAIKLQNYQSPLSAELLYFVARNGEFEEVAETAPLILENNPNSPLTTSLIADLFVQIGETQLSRGAPSERDRWFTLAEQVLPGSTDGP